jgi:Flp pilus assembly pilin Flp
MTEEGDVTSEYALLISLIAMACIVAVVLLGGSIVSLLTNGQLTSALSSS